MRKKEEYKVANNNISNQILGAIDISVDRALQQANFNKTVEGEILYCLNQITGKYRVLIDGVETNAYSLNGTVYSINDRVYIQFQSGKDVTDKYIIGKKQNITTASGIQSLSFDKRYHIGGEFSFAQDPKDNNIYSIQLEKEETVSDYVLEVFQTISCGLQFNLTVTPDNYKDINEDDDNYTITLIDNNNAILTTITMDALEGNPYSMEKQSQVFIFETKDFLGLKSIKINASGRFENKVSIESIKFFVAQDLTDPTVENYLIRKEEYGQLDGSTWTAFKWLSIGHKWQKYIKIEEVNDDTPEKWEWKDADANEKPTHVRTWLELYDKGRRRADLQCHWFVANGTIDEKSNLYSSYMGAGWEKKKTTSAVTVDTNDLANSLIIPFTELPLKNTKYAYYTLLNHLEFAKAEFIITNPLQADGAYTLTQQVTNTGGVDFINGFTIKAQLKLDNQEVPIAAGDIVYDWEVKDIFRGTTLIQYEPGLTNYDYKASGNTLVFQAGAISSILQMRVTVKAYWEKGSTQFFLADDIREYKNSSEIKLYSLQLTNTDQVFYYNGGMREGAEPMPIEAQLVKLNTDTGEWSLVDNDQWKFKGEKPTLLAASLIKDINVNDSEKICGFIVQDIYNASATSNQIKFSAMITSGEEDIEIATEYTNFAFIQSGDSGTNGTEYVAQVYDIDNKKTVNFIFHPYSFNDYGYSFDITELTYSTSTNGAILITGFGLKQQIWWTLDGKPYWREETWPKGLLTPHIGVAARESDSLNDRIFSTDIQTDFSIGDTILYEKDNIAIVSVTLSSPIEISSQKKNVYLSFQLINENNWGLNESKWYKFIIMANEFSNEGDNIKISFIRNENDSYLTENYGIQTVETIGELDTTRYQIQLTQIATGEREILTNVSANVLSQYQKPNILILKATKDNLDYYAYTSIVLKEGYVSTPLFDPVSGFNYILYGSNGKNARASLAPFRDAESNIIKTGMEADQQGYLTYDETAHRFALTQKPLDVNDKYVIIKVNGYEVPILLLKNRYEYASINGWDGNELQLDADGQYILSPMGGFGQKETDNSFTGVVLGESSEQEEIADPTPSNPNNTKWVNSLGLMAYNHGDRTVFIDARTGNAYFKGTIVAGAGDIAGFTINKDKLFKKVELANNIKEVGLSVNTDKNWALWAGKSDDQYGQNAPFRVSHTGDMYAKQGYIGNWEITEDTLKASATDTDKNIKSTVWLRSLNYYWDNHTKDGADVLVVELEDLTKGKDDDTRFSWPFVLRKNGSLHAQKGSIGGWQIKPGLLMSSTQLSDPIEINGKTYTHLGTGIQTTGRGTCAFAAGFSLTGPEAGDSWSATAPFYVTHDGKVNAREANIQGTATLTDATVTNLTLESGVKLGNKKLASKHTPNFDSQSYKVIATRNESKQWELTVSVQKDPSGEVLTSWPHEAISLTVQCESLWGFGPYQKNITIKKNATLPISVDFGDKLYVIFHGSEMIGLQGQELQKHSCDVSMGGSGSESCGIDWSLVPLSANLTLGYGNSSGNTKYYWSALYVKNTSVSGTASQASATSLDSDQKLKYDIAKLSDSYNTIFDNLSPVSFKYTTGESNRTHMGFIAQEVKAAMDKAGLSNQDFAALTIENYHESQDKWKWQLRYEEFVALNTDQIQKLKKRVAQLEAQLEEIKGDKNDSNQ